MESKLKVFESKQIRTLWNADEEEWYFSVVDIVAVLTDSENPNNYWKVLKHRLSKEGSELVTNCNRLKMPSLKDGKSYFTDCLDTKGILRLVQSIPSPKAEPFKMWLAQVGAERLDEIADPEKAILRGAEFYRAKGYTEAWINQRLQTIEMRKELTDEWKARGIVDLKTGEYAKGIMKDLGLDFALPTVKKPTDLAGYVTKQAAREYSLEQGTPVHLGCNDFFAGLLGMGMYALNEAFDLSGTSEHIGWISENLQEKGFVSGGYFNGYCTYGGTKASGVSCDFAIENFGIDGLSLEGILDRTPPIFLPYLKGERAPIFDENARGVYFGLSGETTKKEMAYATLEGVVFSLYDIASSMNMSKPQRLVCGGGSAKNDLMAQIKAELFGCEVVRVKENDTSALGAVMLAMVGDGVFADMDAAIKSCVAYERCIKPSRKYREKLLKRFEIYRELYKNLKETFVKFNEIKEN